MPDHPPEFVPTKHITEERMKGFNLNAGFLQPEEQKLISHLIMEHEEVFAWKESERRRFRADIIHPVKIPVVEHTPWVMRNLPIPPGVRDQLIQLLKDKVDAGVYEPSSSAYRTRWFCVVKKDGTSIRIVHDLQPLNAVTIRDSGSVPHPDDFSERCTGYTVLGVLDLYSSYDLVLMEPGSRDYTTFQTPVGTFRLVSIPMGYTNSMPIQQGNLLHILGPDVPHRVDPFVDDVICKGPKSFYLTEDGSFENHPNNSGIRRFIWEYAENLNRTLQRIRHAGGSISGKKVYICVPKATVVGYECSFEGRQPEQSNVQKIVNWPACDTLREVRGFLGTAAVSRIWIRNFSKIARPLLDLTKKEAEFAWTPACQEAMDLLKIAIVSAPCLKPIDYESDNPVILAVDSSVVAVGFILLQIGDDDRRYPARYGSITWNDRESRYSQAKLELYGLFRALRAVRLYLFAVKNFEVEVDAKYVKGMLNNPDIQPNATINRWIAGILLFNPKLVHVPAARHTGADGLSRRPHAEGDPPEPDDHDTWLDRTLGFEVELINDLPPRLIPAYQTSSHSISYPDSLTPTILAIDNSEHLGALQDPDAVPPRTEKAIQKDQELQNIRIFLSTLELPADIPSTESRSFVDKAAHFFILNHRLMRKSPDNKHRVVVEAPSQRAMILSDVHDALGHKGFFPVRARISDRFWWPYMAVDIRWYIATCHACQIRQTTKIRIPPTVAPIATLFRKVYMDSMILTGFPRLRYLVQARCSLTSWPEWRGLNKETGKAIGSFIFENLLCRWGFIEDIVTDNGTPFVAAVEFLAERYHIQHIRISGYNSQANGLVERKHFDVRHSITKAAEGFKGDALGVIHSVFWAERVTIKKSTGMSPFYMVHGVEPVMPFDIAEATYLAPEVQPWMTTEDLIALRARQLQKRPEDLALIETRIKKARFQSVQQFRDKFKNTIKAYVFPVGAIVLVRNTGIEKSLNRKSKPRYLGPFVVVRRHSGGAYALAELDGSVSILRCAAFRVIPYHPRTGDTFNVSKVVEEATERLDSGIRIADEGEEEPITEETADDIPELDDSDTDQ
jgi:hypothetical protein